MGACAFFPPVYFSFHFVICFLDVLMSGIWDEVAALEEHIGILSAHASDEME